MVYFGGNFSDKGRFFAIHATCVAVLNWRQKAHIQANAHYVDSTLRMIDILFEPIKSLIIGTRYRFTPTPKLIHLLFELSWTKRSIDFFICTNQGLANTKIYGLIASKHLCRSFIGFDPELKIERLLPLQNF